MPNLTCSLEGNKVFHEQLEKRKCCEQHKSGLCFKIILGFLSKMGNSEGYYQGRGEPAGGERVWQSKTNEFQKLF